MKNQAQQNVHIVSEKIFGRQLQKLGLHSGSWVVSIKAVFKFETKGLAKNPPEELMMVGPPSDVITSDGGPFHFRGPGENGE